MLDASVGISYRFHLHEGIRASLHEFDALEVVADQYLAAGGAARAALEDLAKQIPVYVHGLHMSLGSSEQPNGAYLDRVARAVKRLNASCFTEHIAFVQAGGLCPGKLLPLECTEEGLMAIIRNVEILRQRIPIPIMLENITRLVEPAEPNMAEGVFMERLCEATGIKLLLDLENAYSNELNLDSSMGGLIKEIKPGLVGAMHLSGGYSHDGIYIDDHGHDIPEPILGCLEEVVARHKPQCLIIERDQNCDDVEVLLAEVRRVRAALGRVSRA